MVEKRLSRRYLRRLKVRYGLDQPAKLAFTEDVCATGMFIRTYDVLKPGSIINIEIYLSEEKKILLKGCVKWVKKLPPAMVGLTKKAGMGVKILEILSGGDALWREFIETYAYRVKVPEKNPSEPHHKYNQL